MQLLEQVRIEEFEGKGKGIVVCRDFREGEEIMPIQFDGVKRGCDASDCSIQIGEDIFLDTNEKVIDDYVNHSCKPNIKIDFEKLVMLL